MGTEHALVDANVLGDLVGRTLRIADQNADGRPNGIFGGLQMADEAAVIGREADAGAQPDIGAVVAVELEGLDMIDQRRARDPLDEQAAAAGGAVRPDSPPTIRQPMPAQ